MKKNEVKIGKTYRCKVTGLATASPGKPGKLADVRITGENAHGGWDAVNVVTNRKVRIKSPQRLRGATPPRPGKRQVVKLLDDLKEAEGPQTAKRIMTKEEYEAEVRAEATKETESMTAKKTKSKISKKATAKTGSKKAPTKAKGEKRSSGLDAAAQVLAEAGEPLNTKTMVERMLAQGLWKTGGKTPAATIYAAIIREIAAKGGDARFRKTGRGKFELVK